VSTLLYRSIIFEGWVAQILGLIFVAALLSARPRSVGHRLLAVVLLCSVYRQFLLVMQISGALELYPILFRTSFPLQLLSISAFYLYVNALTTSEFKLESRHVVHLIPAVIGIVWYLVLWVWGTPEHFQLGPTYYRERYLRVIVKVLVAIPYLIAARRHAEAFAKKAKNITSDVSPLRLKWLRILFVLAYLSLAIDALDVLAGPRILIWHVIPAFALIALIALSYISLRVSPVFAREVQSYKEAAPEVSEPERNGDTSRSRLSDQELQRQKERLTGVLESKALYLNPELRLSDLATALNIRPYRVSEILSRGLQTSFYDLINSYRVAKAQELLCSPDSAHLNLLGIAMESGFKSKSVFNDVFKKMTGKTPSQFRAGRSDRIA
jgi:AraC-like DNA-binding protein